MLFVGRHSYSKSPQLRYNELICRDPNLFELFSLKDIASLLNITPTHLSRLRKKYNIVYLSTRYSFYGGWRNVKLLAYGECRKIRDCCIFRVNNLELFL